MIFEVPYSCTLLQTAISTRRKIILHNLGELNDT